jgi:hypothetical protein
MPMPRLQRFWLLGAVGFVSLLAMQSCLSPNKFVCPANASAQAAGSPCDIYGAAQTACVAAFSTTRALYGSYAGPLYQVTRQSDRTAANIGVLSDGFADAAAQDGFCANTTCTITRIFDQSPYHNDLTVAPPGFVIKGKGPGGEDLPAVADSLPVTAGGHKVYGVYISAGMGYRNDATSGVPLNAQPEGVYMVASGIHVYHECCFDFGNAERNNRNNGSGHMDAIRLGCGVPCNPFVGLDMENGTYPPFPVSAGIPFVTAMGTNDGQQNYAVYWGNAGTQCLETTGSIPLPSKDYTPMHQEGAIILGTGGDNSNSSEGSFFEGAMTAGAPSSATMVAVQANVVSVGYAAEQNAESSGPSEGQPSVARCSQAL